MSRMLKQAMSQESFGGSNEITQEAILESELAVEESITEINEAHHSLEMLDYQQEELEFAHQSLEDIAVSLESHLKEDERGIDRQTAEAYHHAVNAIVGDALDNPVASLESFGGESESSHATQMSLEGIKDIASKIWEGIKKAVNSAMEAVKKFFNKLFGGIEKLKSRCDKLEKQYEKLKKDGYKASGKFEVPKAEKIAMGGKVDTKIIGDGLKLVGNTLMDSTQKMVEASNSYYSSLAGFYKKPENPDDFYKVEEEGYESVMKALKDVKEKELPGGKQVTCEEKNDKDYKQVPKVMVSDYDGGSDPKDGIKIDVPSLDWIGDQIKVIKDVIKVLESKDKAYKELSKNRDEVVKGGDKFTELAKKAKLKEGWNEAMFRMAMKSANKDLVGVIGKLCNYVFNYTTAVAGVLNAAMKSYSKEGSQEGKNYTKGDEPNQGDDDYDDEMYDEEMYDDEGNYKGEMKKKGYKGEMGQKGTKAYGTKPHPSEPVDDD